MTRLSAAVLSTVFGVYSVVFASATRVPKIWDDEALAEWATPVAGLNVRPSLYSAAEYYAAPVDNFRTYPVFATDKEPPGYWDWLQKQTAQPLVDVNQIRVESDWIAAGERAFREMDAALLRTDDPDLIARARDKSTFEGAFTFPDGSVLGPRWVVTPRGVMLGVRACAACHVGRDSGDRVMFAGPGFPDGDKSRPFVVPGMPLVGAPGTQWRLRRMYVNDRDRTAFWREFTVPWAPDERVERFKTMLGRELQQQELVRSFSGGVFARTNGSPFAVTKIPDLHNLRYSHYLDATGTHRLRGPEDVARYAALVTGADRMDFGPHRILTDEQRHLRFRYADEVLYAIGVYLMSLEPPKNPSPAPRETIDRGERVFKSEGCARCHRPPSYTTGRLTLAQGYVLPPDHPNRGDVMGESVETDPDVALQTRKGTGLYKIPSLRGVWYRQRLLHDGSLASLEEMFDPARLHSDYAPKGWNPPGVTTRAVRGHMFGLDLDAKDTACLLAFLRSL